MYLTCSQYCWEQFLGIDDRAFVSVLNKHESKERIPFFLTIDLSSLKELYI
jgi:hypothetical protein